MADEISQRVISVIARTQGIKPEMISVGSTFDELDIDSLSAMNIVFELEQEFGIDIPNEEALTVRNVRQAAESVGRLVKGSVADAAG